MTFDQKILIIRFSSIGDIVLATSPLKTIRKAFPDAQINFLTLDDFAPILEFHPDIDRLILLSKNKKIYDLWRFSDFIRKQNFDYIFDLHNSVRSNFILLTANSRVFQLKKPRWNRFTLFQFHENQFDKDFSTMKMYHQFLGDIWKNGDKIPESSLVVSKAEKKLAHTLVGESAFICLIPGAAWAQKQWSSAKYIELIRSLKKPIVLLGSKADKICYQIAKKDSTVINLAGKTSLRQAMAIISNSSHVIGSDTGLTHAAEALGISVTMILGPTSTQTGAGVHLKKSTNVEKDIWCRPCSQNGKRPCYRQTQVCMDSISVSDVVQTLSVG